MEDYNKLKSTFIANADTEYAKGMSAYMRNKWQYLGLRSPVRKEMQKEFLKKMKRADFETIGTYVDLFWNEPYREFQYTACEILRENVKKIPLDYIANLEQLITTKSWWDSVDSIAPTTLGDYFSKYPSQIQQVIPLWINSDNIWLKRSAILYQLKYKSRTDIEYLLYIINCLKDTNEFFINKAIGWALREYSKTNPDLVYEFVNETQLSSLSEREALKIINKTNRYE